MHAYIRGGITVDETKGNEKIVLSLRDLLYTFFKKKIIVAAIIVICVLLSIIYTKFLCTPQYVSCAKIVVFSNAQTNSNNNTINSSEFAISTYLVSDYSELIIDRAVLNTVAENLGLNVSYEQFRRAVSIKNPENSRILEVYVRTTSPHASQQIADEICEVARVKMLDLLGVDKVNIFSSAYLPKSPSSPSLSRNIMVGFLAGMLICAVYLFIIVFTNDKISDENEIEQYLGLCTLGVIPYNSGKQRSKTVRKA